MAEGYNVELNTKAKIEFPTECLMCGRDAKGQKRTLQIGPLNRDLALSSKIKNTINVPMHRNCSRKFGIAFWKRYGTILILIPLLFLLGEIYFNKTIGQFYKHFGQYLLWSLFFLLGIVAIFIPIILWWHNHPLQIECDYEKGNYVFTFKDRIYAEKFAQLNKTQVKQRV